MTEHLTENELVELAAGRLADDAQERALAHIDACAACCELLAVATQEGPGEPPPAAPAVGRYVLAELIGAGAFGAVYRAFDPSLGRYVALKLLHARGEGPAADEKLLAEAHSLARLQHPNVVTIHDVGTRDGQVFLAMELGRTSLRDWLHESPRATGEVLPLLRQAGEGLAAAHATGLVHRDVKPDNILITQGGRAMVTDFGLARVQATAGEVPDDAPVNIATVTVAGLVGTPAYMAPEQLRGTLADERSDQFAFCATMFEALTGTRPFAATTLQELREAATHDEVDRAAAAKLPGWLRRIVLRGLRADPAARWPSLRHLLDALAAGPPLSRTGVRLGIVAGVAGVLLISSLVWGIVESSRQRARAERRFADVRQLASSFLFEFDAKIANLAGATSARRLVVQRAQEYLDGLAAEAADDLQLARELATAYERLHDIQAGSNSSMGDTAGALRSLEKAIAIRERLAAATGDDDDLAALAKTLLSSAAMHPMEAAALAEVQRALAVRESLVARKPDDVRWRRGLAAAYLELGDLTAMRGDYAQGIVWKRKARDMFEVLAAAHPDIDTDQRNAALGAKYLGALLQKTGDRAAARALYERAVALDGMRVAKRPHDATAKLDLSYSEASLANLQGGDGNFTAALAGYRRALALREAVAAADPANRTAQARVARAHAAIAGILGQQGDHGAEMAENVRAVGLYEALAAADPADSDLGATLAEATTDLAYSAIHLAVDARRRGVDPAPHLAAARAWATRATELLERLRPNLNTQQLETAIVAAATRAMAESLTAVYAVR